MELTKKQIKKWSETHKLIDNVDYKLCRLCEEWLPSNTEYFYKNKSSKIDGLHSWCKKCSTKKSLKWKAENPEKVVEYRRDLKERDPDRVRATRKKSYNKNKEREQMRVRQWQRDNKDRIREYNLNRSNKNHDITEQEWLDCLEFFNHSCAYCGINEFDILKEQGQLLHKEHVEHNGVNDITNCVPACRSCNSRKWEFEFSEWYTPKNPSYSKRRENEIVKWLLSFTE